ncbi:MAG: N-6 DNA methylase [Elusimicrobiota bacterium]
MQDLLVNYRPYNKYLEKLLVSENINNSSVNEALNGAAFQYLKKEIDNSTLKRWGIFFTGHSMADLLIENHSKDLEKGINVFDPTCGAGDLLIACAKKFPYKKTLKETVDYWGEMLFGFDVHEEFVNTTKLKLLLLAKSKCNSVDTFSISEVFPNIKTADFLSTIFDFKNIDLVIMNPPYVNQTISENVEWGSGKLSIAAFFVEKCVKNICDKTKLVALLPDVLCTGSRYEKWRKIISNNAKELKLNRIGLFDKSIDVDVFKLDLKQGTSYRNIKWHFAINSRNKVDNLFDVRVGAVVPHRDKKIGKKYPYIYSRNTLPWKEIIPCQEQRQFNKTVFLPPFVVVRRTSGPRDKHRAVASIIKGNKHVAVENHLIILKPKNGGIKLCRELMYKLKQPYINEWLNQRISCRHLTVSAIGEIPWRE